MGTDTPGPVRPPLATIALLSATALAYEILLLRLFSIIQWHHFAYMIISLALLGYGASGTFLAFVQRPLLQRYRSALVLNLGLFAISALLCYLLAQRISFNPEELLWDWRAFFALVTVYLLLSLPFFFAANAIALTLSYASGQVGRVYAADLVGAGAGSVGIIMALYLLTPANSLLLVSLLGLLCVPLAMLEMRAGSGRVLVAAMLAAGLAVVLASIDRPLLLSPYKDLSQALRVVGAERMAQRSSPLASLDVVENLQVPLRHAPGLSLNASSGPPHQMALFSDGNLIGAITRATGQSDDYDYLDMSASALPYHLRQIDRVLILGAGGGREIRQARHQGAGQVVAVELNEQVTDLLRGPFAEFSDQLFSQPGVHIQHGEVRGFLAQNDDLFDLVYYSAGGGGASSGGLFALSEDYLLTERALDIYLDHLAPGGYLVIDQWMRLPPRDALKLFAMLVQVLRDRGVSEPGSRLVLLRSWQTSVLLVKNGVITGSEIKRLIDFAQARSFDLSWYPGIAGEEVNRFNRLREPYLYEGAQALLGDQAQDFMQRYKFDLQPATDDRPFFHDFFRWSTLPEILRLRGQGGLPLLESGYPVLLATLLQACIISAVLILLPLLVAGRRTLRQPALRVVRWQVLCYFFAIGLAFLFVEIAFIQKFMLFLHHPLLSVSVVLASFLVFAGIGSSLSQRYSRTGRRLEGVRLAVILILLIGAGWVLLLDPLFHALMPLTTVQRTLVSAVLIAPLAVPMGALFPLGVDSLAARGAGELIPLAWGVNGCASVLSAVLATLLAIETGFTAVVLIALVLYLLALRVFPGAHIQLHQ